ncbi:IS110 family transposase [Salinarimonas rosea]|uniref:IS110 family transposase n=1 Tax=Salinarimonas rosea TaxID=552063 RepID=UPI0004112033|nr:IS110 family transposase [Salinarimonas rosea]
MGEVSIIGVDLAKNVFQVHGAAADGSVLFRRKLRRGQVLSFFATQPACTVAMEACASAHHWAHAIGDLGHAVKLIPPAYVKPFVKRQKSDATDAEAIAEAATRATMRFVAVKTEAQQASAMAYRTRDLFVRQRTQTINALRGHLAEFGVVAPTGIAHVGRLTALVEGEDGVLPEAVVELARMLLIQIEGLSERIETLEKQIRERAAQDEAVARLMTMPGIGAITATALVTFAPAPETFAKGRDFAAWVGLTPRQHSTGGRERLGRITRMGQRDIRRLLITGAVGVVRWAARKGAPEGSWLARMLAKKPRMLVAVALANRMARMAWAMMSKNESYRVPAAAA